MMIITDGSNITGDTSTQAQGTDLGGGGGGGGGGVGGGGEVGGVLVVELAAHGSK